MEAPEDMMSLQTLFDPEYKDMFINISEITFEDYAYPTTDTQMTEMITSWIVQPILVTTGIVGNVLNVLVLSRQSMASPTTLFLRALAVSDILLMVCMIPQCLNIFHAVQQWTAYQEFYKYYLIGRYFVGNVLVTCISWLTIAITVERFIAIRYILKVKVICTAKRIKITIAVICLLSLVLEFSKLFEFATDLSSKKQFFTTLDENEIYVDVSYISHMVLAVWIPMMFLIITNVSLVYHLVRHKNSLIMLRIQLRRQAKEMRRVTHIVIAMVAVFIICNFLEVVLTVAVVMNGRPETLLHHSVYPHLKHVSNTMVILNSAINFILYCMISRKFRMELVKMVAYRKRPTKRSSSSSTSTLMMQKTSTEDSKMIDVFLSNNNECKETQV